MMRKPLLSAALLVIAPLAHAHVAVSFTELSRPAHAMAPVKDLQCVPYARLISGIQITGDARTWWQQASGRYARGFAPKVGAVMAFRPHGAMALGHVAIVSRLIDPRTILLRHANWSPIHGHRGQIETDVKAVDVSPANDWSAVRVWFDPAQGLGSTHWPVEGFIYNRPAAPSEHAPTRAGWMSDPIGAIMAAFSRP
jgi:surface antigen